MSEKTPFIFPNKKQKELHPKRCETCINFDPIENDPDGNGNCVANYPVVFPLGTSSGGRLVAASVFPAMKPEQRCAKWETPLGRSSTEA